MEVAAGRGGSLPMASSQTPRKEWRAVSEHSLQNNGDEDPDHLKLGQSNERTIYEEGTGALEVDFCSITIDGGGSNGDLLQRQINDISRQREELQQVEIELRAQAIARSEIVGLQNSFDAQIKEHANAAAKLREQLEERERCIHDLEMNMEEKEREIRAVKIDNEAVWAKEDLLREQNKELATFRREHDNSEAERAEHLKQIHEFQEHIHELKEQYRVAQETILYKDEQLRAWVARVQEMDAVQSTTNQSLQAELRERTDHFNQYWIGVQGQFVEMERLHLQSIQQLQRELAEAREKNGIKYDDSHLAGASSESSSYVQNLGNQFNINDSGTTNGNPVFLSNGSMNGSPSFVSGSNASTKTEHVPGVAVVPSSILGMSTFLPPGQMTAVHPFVMHPQGAPQSVTQTNSQIPQSQLGHFQPIQPFQSHQHWQNQQMSNQNQYQPSQTEPNLLRSDAQYSYELSTEGQIVHSDYLESHSSPHHISGKIITGSSEGVQVMNEKVLDSNATRYSGSHVPQVTLHGDPEFRAMLGLDSPMQNGEPKLHDEKSAASTYRLQDQALTTEQPWSADKVAGLALSNNVVISNDGLESNAVGTMPEVSVSTARSSGLLMPGKAPEPTLLDERSLLACIVRAIPAGPSGRIRISTTLPNRLGKMIAPLHWHDYKKQYGKLDDFVGLHPELFVIEGDFIHLREGAQEIISATTAVAKVAAAAAASAPYSSPLSSVAVTPVAQTHRLKRVPSTETKPVNNIPYPQITVQGYLGGSSEKPKQLLTRHNQQPNGVGFNVIQGLSNVKILSKTKNLQELNGLSSEIRVGHSSVHGAVENGMSLDRVVLPSSQNKVSSNGRHSIAGKQQGRATAAGQTARR